MTSPSQMHSTLPYIGGAAERRALVAGMSFLDLVYAGRMDLQALAAWFDEHVVASGCMPPVSVVLEPQVGAVALHPGTSAIARANADLVPIIEMARKRVVEALRCLVAPPADDRFLRAAIFLGRVHREDGAWVARPEPTAPLSAIVLSLFAVAILSERTFYDRRLCVCDTCGRVSFDATHGMRLSCRAHPPRLSGVTLRATGRPPAAAPTEARRAG